MSIIKTCIQELESVREYFNRSTRGLTEEHSQFAPAPGMMTTAQLVAHVAQTIDWFMEGAFRPEGFSMDFEKMGKELEGVTSLAAAREWFERSIESAKAVLASKSDPDMLSPLPAGPIMGGQPTIAIISAITDHTAHHRGALTVYSRLNNIVPPMPYMEM